MKFIPSLFFDGKGPWASGMASSKATGEGRFCGPNWLLTPFRAGV
jgi:hypothetical protein